MDRKEIESWLREHPDDVRIDVGELLDRCERAVLRHAREDAWLRAKEFALDRARSWREEWSAPASEHFVTHEVCHELAWELAHHEPRPEEGDEERLVGGPVREVLSAEAWRRIGQWALGLAAREEHRAWLEIVDYTDHRAREIIRREGFSRETGWDRDHRYTTIAAHVAEILAQEYSQHAYPR